MIVLREVLEHPENRGRPLLSLWNYLSHNIDRRLRPSRVITLKLGSSLLSGPTDHPTMNWARYVRSGRYDIAAFELMDGLLEPGDLFIDIGANIGSYCVHAAERLGVQGTVVAVEPAQDQVVHLRSNLKRCPTHHVILEAPVADRVRNVSFLQGGPTMGRLADIPGGATETTTVDELITEHSLAGLAHRSLMKIDVEGWEPAVISGATTWLSSRPKGLIVEAHGFQDRSPVAWEEAVDLVIEHGYRFVWPDLEQRRVHLFPQPPAVSPFGDYLAVRDDLLGVVEAVTTGYRAT